MEATMKRLLIIATILALLGSVGEAEEKNASVLLQAAMAKESVHGDLNGAIQLYESALKHAGADRVLAARALLKIAQCYEKLGSTESQKAYERILRDYADQKEAVALARAGLRPSAKAVGDGVIQRFVKTGRNVGGFSPSPDGRYFAFHNWDTNGNLALHDLATGVQRDITHESPWQSGSGVSQYPIFTPDSKRIVYTRVGTFAENSPNIQELRIIGVDGKGMRTILRNPEYRYVSDYGISVDGNTVAALLGLKDQTWQIALVSLDSGKVRVLKTIGWARPAVGNFSADGRWIVYSVPTQDATSGNHEVYSIAVDGSAEFRIAPAIASNRTPYFSPDGSRAVFVGERLGQRVLWSVRVSSGKPLGAPEVLKTDVGTPMGFTADGSLYFLEDSFRIGVFSANADPRTWKSSGAPKEISSPLRQSSAVDPAWSPDGKLLAYSVPSGSVASKTAYSVQMESTYSKATTIVIRNQASGQEREILVHGGRLRGWFPESNSLLVNTGARGLRTVEISTGKERVLIDKEVGLPAASISGKAIFYYLRDSGFSSQAGKPRPSVDMVRIMRREAGSDEEKELFHLETDRGIITDLSPSPDGSHVAFIALLPSKGAGLFVVSASGGAARQVRRLQGTLAGGFAWTGDGKALLFIRDPEEPSKGSQVWAIPIDGAAAYATGIVAGTLYSLSVHPDGPVAFTARVREADQVSVLDNLVPKSSRK
jgi:Tol biopolymer transport system component